MKINEHGLSIVHKKQKQNTIVLDLLQTRGKFYLNPCGIHTSMNRKSSTCTNGVVDDSNSNEEVEFNAKDTHEGSS